MNNWLMKGPNSIQAYMPKEVAQYLGLRDKGKLEWCVPLKPLS